MDYEKLGAFYLGKELDPATGKRRDDIVLYDSKDLTTHAVIIGMTGSGKTGLGLSLLEEALIDNIPVIAVDPKGDLPNLLLTFPRLRPEDFRPWINEQDAVNAGMSSDEFAKNQAELWTRGLGEWDQSGDRIRKLRETVSFAVYTPGSTAGRSLSVLRTLAPPQEELRNDPDLWRDAVQGTATGLLALMGLTGDPLASREHILIANILDSAWSEGRSLDLAAMVRAIQKPPFQRLGVLDLESFYPTQDRFQLAMRLNNLLASPGFEAWIEGEPLDIQSLLHGEGGRPRASVISIAHLGDAERMFFMTMLLNRVVSWIRTQPGTTSLRAVLYIDEIFGFFPPVANPPSKPPLLTLLKQARAHGLGVVLATQNPVDLDYKGLANAGTWMIGRLQTERDKSRVLEGLEGTLAGTAFERQRLDQLLAGLRKRVFLLHNVHESEPVLFETRWAMSYLRGPMTRDEIRRLQNDSDLAAPVTVTAAAPRDRTARQDGSETMPVAPPGVESWVLPPPAGRGNVEYEPCALGIAEVHYVNGRHGVDESRRIALAAPIGTGAHAVDWSSAADIELEPEDLEDDPLPGAKFRELPRPALDAKNFTRWRKEFEQSIRQSRGISLYRSAALGLTSTTAETENDFRARLAQAAREKRDLDIAKLRARYEPKMTVLQNRLRRAEHSVSREAEQSSQRKIDTAVSFSTAIFGAFLGRKRVSVTSASRVGTAVGKATRIRKDQSDVARARESLEAVRAEMSDLEAKLEDEAAMLAAAVDPAEIELEEITIRPAAKDIRTVVFGLAWRA
jgi:hypothetical protein